MAKKKPIPQYQIDRFEFHLWDGPPPDLPRRIVQTFARAGVNGYAASDEGLRGSPFDVTLTTYLSALSLQPTTIKGYLALVGANPVELWFAGLRYKTAHNVTFEVLDVRELELRAARVVGKGIDFQTGSRLVTRWRLVAVTV